MRFPARRGFAPLLTSLLASTGLAMAAGCAREPAAEPAPAGTLVAVVSARMTDLTDTLTTTGTIVPATSADFTVVAPDAAQIAEVPKQEGDAVAEGDLLVRFDVPAITQELAQRQSEVAESTARLDRAKRELESGERLLERGLIARQKVEAARQEANAAQTALTDAQARLGAARILEARTVVRARFAGVVAKQWRFPGDFVTAANDPVLRVVDPSRTQVALSVSLAEVARISNGQSVTVRVPGQDDQTGMIVSRPEVIDPSLTIVPLRVNFTTPTTLPVDSVVEVVIVTDSRPNALVVPRAALQRDEESAYVLVAGEDGRAQRRTVQTGLITSDLVQVLSGVKLGEPVIVTAVDQLTDGAPIVVNR